LNACKKEAWPGGFGGSWDVLLVGETGLLRGWD